MITTTMLRTDAPPVTTMPDGSANVILGLVCDGFYAEDGSNSYISNWQAVTAIWYVNNADHYRGWIELEYVPLPPFKDE